MTDYTELKERLRWLGFKDALEALAAIEALEGERDAFKAIAEDRDGVWRDIARKEDARAQAAEARIAELERAVEQRGDEPSRDLSQSTCAPPEQPTAEPCTAANSEQGEP